MFCRNCGKEIPENSAYCSFCGLAVQPTTEARHAVPYPASRPTAVTDVIESDQFGVILLGLGILMILGALGAQSYCSSFLSGCQGLVYPNQNSLYVVEGLGALVFVIGLLVLVRRYVSSPRTP
jgi:hypothetical protein